MPVTNPWNKLDFSSLSSESSEDESIFSSLLSGPLQPNDLAQRLQTTPGRILSRLEKLRLLGYTLTVDLQQNWHLTHSPDTLVTGEIRARLPGNIFSRHLTVHQETRSTNDLALKAGGDGRPEGFSVLAEMQTHGRGTKNRHWHAADKKGLWLSMLFRPDWQAGEAFRLTYMASVALCRSVRHLTGLPCGIKWPNDVMLAGKKLAGVLTETRISGSRLEYAVVGIGCNLKQRKEDFTDELQGRATSLLIEGAPADLRRADFLVQLLREITLLYQMPPADLFEEWKKLCLNAGCKIRVQTGHGVLEGLMAGLEKNGHLLLELPDGKIEVINSGEILF